MCVSVAQDDHNYYVPQIYTNNEILKFLKIKKRGHGRDMGGDHTLGTVWEDTLLVGS